MFAVSALPRPSWIALARARSVAPAVARCLHADSTHRHRYVPIEEPGHVTPPRSVPASIITPPPPSRAVRRVDAEIAAIHTPEDIAAARAAGKLARETLLRAAAWLQPGRTTEDVDRRVHEYIVAAGAYPAPLRYRGFPKSICTSVNNVAVHGIPDDRPLQLGDLVKVDVTVFRDSFHGDTCGTFVVGETDEAGHRLIRTTIECLDLAIDICGPGVSYNAIGWTIEDHADACGFKVCREFVGHGIGRTFHGPPDVLHFRNQLPFVMQTGHMFTIEPILLEGTRELVMFDDGWTCMTVDGGRAAQQEHTLLVTDERVDVLTGPTITPEEVKQCRLELGNDA